MESVFEMRAAAERNTFKAIYEMVDKYNDKLYYQMGLKELDNESFIEDLAAYRVSNRIRELIQRIDFDTEDDSYGDAIEELVDTVYAIIGEYICEMMMEGSDIDKCGIYLTPLINIATNIVKYADNIDYFGSREYNNSLLEKESEGRFRDQVIESLDKIMRPNILG